MALWAEFRDEARNVATGRPVEVLPGIFELRDSLRPVLPTAWVSLWVFADPAGKDRPAIVDTGVPDSMARVIEPGLRWLGIAPRDLAVACNTHNHSDHAGSNVALRAATGCQIWIHRDEAPGLERTTAFPAHRADRLLEEGDRLRLAGREWTVVPLPGHSRGSIGLYERERKVLLCGDGLQAAAPAEIGIAMVRDRDAYLQTLDRVAALEIDHLLAAHPFVPFEETHVRPRTEVARFLAACRRYFDEIGDELVRVVSTFGGAATTAQIAARLCASRGVAEPLPFVGNLLETTYLQRLEAAGRLLRSGEGGETRWSLPAAA